MQETMPMAIINVDRRIYFFIFSNVSIVFVVQIYVFNFEPQKIFPEDWCSYCGKMRKYRYLCTSLQRRYLTEIESDK